MRFFVLVVIVLCLIICSLYAFKDGEQSQDFSSLMEFGPQVENNVQDKQKVAMFEKAYNKCMTTCPQYKSVCRDACKLLAPLKNSDDSMRWNMFQHIFNANADKVSSINPSLQFLKMLKEEPVQKRNWNQ